MFDKAVRIVSSLCSDLFAEPRDKITSKRRKPILYNGHNWKVDATSKTAVCADCEEVMTVDNLQTKAFEQCEGWFDD